MFVGMARRLHSRRSSHLEGASLGLAQALLANDRLGWKSLPETITHWAHSKIYEENMNKISCCEYSLGAVFTKLHFLCNFGIGLIS